MSEQRDCTKWPRYRIPLVLQEDEWEEEDDDLAHIVTMDEAAFLRLMEEASK